VILSSHLVPDLERVCDYLIGLVASRVQLAGETEELSSSTTGLSAPAVRHRPVPGGSSDPGRAIRPGIRVPRAQRRRTARRGLVRRAPRPGRPAADLHGTRRGPRRRATTDPARDAR
jgi:hypothetical protein